MSPITRQLAKCELLTVEALAFWLTRERPLGE
jgi:hypothetical protein